MHSMRTGLYQGRFLLMNVRKLSLKKTLHVLYVHTVVLNNKLFIIYQRRQK